ncbi:MAG: hypothetical protein LBQ94_06965 [Treponema sp.]|jgi:hypothetical protein|nr:hypothetical protein [Treponema sp.]
MAKRFFLGFILILALTGSVFSAELFKHQRGDMYVGANLGMGFTPNLFNVISVNNTFPRGNYALTFDLGLSYGYYQTEWLSFSAGLLAHFGMYAFLPNRLQVGSNTGFFDIAAAPLALTIPLSAHINIPYVSFLYAGVGMSLNIPMVSLLNSDDPDDPRQREENVFLGIPIDVGFDLMPEGSGGMRIFFRITPEFHASGTVMPIGFVWQVFNLKIR